MHCSQPVHRAYLVCGGLDGVAAGFPRNRVLSDTKTFDVFVKESITFFSVFYIVFLRITRAGLRSYNPSLSWNLFRLRLTSVLKLGV